MTPWECVQFVIRDSGICQVKAFTLHISWGHWAWRSNAGMAKDVREWQSRTCRVDRWLLTTELCTELLEELLAPGPLPILALANDVPCNSSRQEFGEVFLQGEYKIEG